MASLAPGAANASTLDVDFEGGSTIYAALPGEVNDVTMTYRTDPALVQPSTGPRRMVGEVVVVDPSVLIQPSSPSLNTYELKTACLFGVGRASCRYPERFIATLPPRTDQIPNSFQIFLGDGNDSARDRTVGTDVIFDGPGDDKVIGGNGRTTFHNGTGRDDLWGGYGRDSYSPYADSGNASEYYSRDVQVSLDNLPNDGFEGAHKNVHGDIENVFLWEGDDRIEGNWRPNELSASGGNDTIIGGTGQDKLDGGAGNDTIDAADGEPDRIDCGRGNDVAIVDRVDVIVSDSIPYPDAGCETVTVAG